MRSRPITLLLAVIVVAALAAGSFLLLAGSDPQHRTGLFDRGTDATGAPGYKVSLSEFKLDKTTIKQCYATRNHGVSELDECLRQAYGNLAYTKGPAVALQLLRRNELKVAKEVHGCHQVAHMIGGAAFAYYKGNTSRALADGTILCGSGYYHGLLQRSLQLTPNGDMDRQLSRMCMGLDQRSALAIQCGHGVGHSMMLATSYDLPRSVRACQHLPKTANKDACWTGAFMENQYTEFGLRSKYFDEKDLLYPCNDMKVVLYEPAQRICYSMTASKIAERLDENLPAVAPWCARTPARHRGQCFQAWGQMAGQWNDFDAGKLRKICPELRKYQHESYCWRGAAVLIVEFSGDARTGAKMCNGAPKWDQGNCWYGIGKRLNMTTLGKLDQVPRTCGELTRDPYLVKRCRSGMKLEDEYLGGDHWPLPDPPYPGGAG